LDDVAREGFGVEVVPPPGGDDPEPHLEVAWVQRKEGAPVRMRSAKAKARITLGHPVGPTIDPLTAHQRE
jgi:hypothetical protein